MLLSAGDFAMFHSESQVFNLLAPRFGGMRSDADRRALMRTWLKSKQFQVSGLDGDDIREKILLQCKSAGDFLRLSMESIAKKQGARRWADCTPDHLLYIREIKREIPDALIIHIIRDGRDVALSYAKQRWTHPFPWDRGDNLAVAGLFWEWIVRKGRRLGKDLGEDYVEVRFEDLVTNPRPTLALLSQFTGCDLDYDRIQLAGVGSVSKPNSSFTESADGSFHPVGRWKTQMTPDQLVLFASLVGELLQDLGYDVKEQGRGSMHAARLKATYLPLFGLKHWLKNSTPLGRFAHTGNLYLQASGLN